jgi:hypothetical protein
MTAPLSIKDEKERIENECLDNCPSAGRAAKRSQHTHGIKKMKKRPVEKRIGHSKNLGHNNSDKKIQTQ